MPNQQHILIIRLSAMGDVAIAVPVIRELIREYPTTRVTVVSKPFLKPLFDDLSNVSFFAAEVTKKHKGLLGLYRLYQDLKKEKITHIADFHNVLRSKILRSFFMLHRKPTAVINKGRSEKKALIRQKNKIFKQLKTSHQRYADVLNSLGFSIDLSSQNYTEKKSLSKNVIALVGLKKNNWIGIAPFAAFAGKVYPINLMEKVIIKIASRGKKVFLFGGGKNEAEILKTIEKKHENILSIAGKVSFKEELELIGFLDLMISMDSGNAHLAAMKQIKTITIWGNTHPYAGFAPFFQPNDYCLLPDLEKYPKVPSSVYGNKELKGYENIMESICPETIINKAMSVLNSQHF